MAIYSNPEGTIPQVHKLHSTDLTEFRLFPATWRKLILWNSVEQLIVAQLVKKSVTFMELESLLLLSMEKTQK
jgi:hypothetical protein